MLRSLICLLIFVTTASAEITPERTQNSVILDPVGVKNLKIQTVEAEETQFEEASFALGTIEALPSRRAAVTSRIPGRIARIQVSAGDRVQAGEVVVLVESRQAGDPPPTIPLKAPLGGTITSSAATLGQSVEPDATLMEIIDLDEVQAVAEVPEHLAGKIQPGTFARIRLISQPDQTFDATLARVGTLSDKENGTLEAIFVLPNPDHKLRPGMRAEFSLVINKREGVMSIPRAALQGDQAARFVYVADYELPNTFVKTPVVVGAMNDRFVEILEGIFPGDQVVTQGSYSLAFAGKGSVSLKDALDAAHGHEHNADGSEIGKDSKSETSRDHGESHGPSMLTLISLAANVLLLALLFVARKKRNATAGAASC